MDVVLRTRGDVDADLGTAFRASRDVSAILGAVLGSGGYVGAVLRTRTDVEADLRTGVLEGGRCPQH